MVMKIKPIAADFFELISIFELEKTKLQKEIKKVFLNRKTFRDIKNNKIL